MFRRHGHRIAGWLAALIVLGAASAHADRPKLHLQRVDVDKYPLIKAYLTLIESDGRIVTGKTKDDFKLVFDSNEQGAAADAVPIDQTGEPAYVVLVVQISQAMHDVIEDGKRGVKQIAQAAADMKGSKVALITYAQDVKRVAELGKPEAIDGAAGGVQEDAQGAESHLLDSIRTSIDLLNARGVPDNARKMIVVFSDGIDVSGSEKKIFSELGKRANLAGIVIDTIGYNPFQPDKLKNLFELSKQTSGVDRACKSAQDVGAQFSNTADELRKQYVVLFQSVVAGDSKEHGIQVVTESGSGPVFSQTMNKTCVPHEPPPPPGKPWWFWLLVIGLPLLLVVGVVGFILSRRRGAVEEVPVAPEPAQVEAAPQRTIAIDLGGGNKGPTVGWIVGLTGRYTEKTFKLLPQRTVIGTSTEADIQIEDPKVSRKHCEIRFDGYTYKIVDLGSTNGVVLNDKRTPSSDLVDGDTFRLGGIEFKFKSIN